MKKYVVGLLILLFVLNACSKERFYKGSNNVLEFSSDTLTFDTVFTTLGTVTRYFKVKNTINETVNINELRLAGLQGNTFRINVDGISGTVFYDVQIPPKDSIYIFAEATIDPNNQNNPFIVLDEIDYMYNGAHQKSYLQAWGQDAYFHYGEIIEGDSIWNNDKPHVVIRNGSFPGIGIEAWGSLTINPGCMVYFGPNSGIFTDGPITIGSAGCMDSVVLQTSRIEDLPNGLDFDETPGMWIGVILRRGATGTFNNVTIKNAVYGISGSWIADDFNEISLSNKPVINLDKVQIFTCSSASLFALNAEITASNSLFYNANTNTTLLALGGKYNFTNCTFYGNGEDECLALSNYASNGSQGAYADMEQANFTNCIVYGSKTDEVLLNNESAASFTFNFTNCLLKTTLNTDTSTYVNCIINQNPQFESVSESDFHLNDISPCIGAGTNVSLITDLYCNLHNNPIDLGAIAH